MDYLTELNLKLHSLVVFRNLLCDRVLALLPAVLSCGDGRADAVEAVNNYAHFAAHLFVENENLSDYIWDRVLSDENIYVLKSARKESMDSLLEQCVVEELKALEEIARLTGPQVKQTLGYEGYLPAWSNRPIDFVAGYRQRICNIATVGYGVFSKHLMFCLDGGGIVPVQTPDPVRMTDLVGYETERELVVRNTLALLSGKPAANVLLYGDAGTGKSSTVKAIVNELGNQGLRLIEVRKNQLLEIPRLVESLGPNPLKFILFIDDLSFAQNNEEIGALKAILEGSVSAKTPNVAIYATSNRRHLVKEKFSERGNDDIHRNESIQEQVSLSARFGLAVYFAKPDQRQYLSVVTELLKQQGLSMAPEELKVRAEAYALERGGRSPRVARQFVEYLKSMEA